MPRELTLREFFYRRGYKTPISVPNVLWRWSFVSFTQSPFGGFWRVWNPYFGFYLSKIYRRLGGDNNRVVACLATFAVCGLFHDAMSLIMDEPHRMRLKAMYAFIIFGIMVAATSPLSVQRVLRKLPRPVNILLNGGHMLLAYFCAHKLWKLTEHALQGQFPVGK